MATRFRALSAPIDASTGDRRRFAEGAITTQPLPAPLRWVREDVGGHDRAVVVGRIDSVEFSADEVWVSGVLFDDIDRERLPRLAEDVAEAVHLASNGVLGLSVDLDQFDAQPVRVGSDAPIDLDEVTESDQLELLVTAGRIRSATLVAIPAFAETNHTVTLTEDGDASPTLDEVAALTAESGVYDVKAFLPPVDITGPTPITYDWDNGVVYGHIYQHDTCHVGISDRCAQPPVGRDDYKLFHRYTVETTDGPVQVGRLTAGGYHANKAGTFTQVVAEHDKKVTAAHVRAWEDDYGIMICGPLVDGLDPNTVKILSRRKVSGHWPEFGDDIALVEILALPPGNRMHSEPGFPVGVHVRNSRVVGLVAALGPDPIEGQERIDYIRLGREVAAAVREQQSAEREAQQDREEAYALLRDLIAEEETAEAAELRELLGADDV